MGKPGQTEHTGPASQREDVEGDLGKEPACVTACMTMVVIFMLEFAIICIWYHYGCWHMGNGSVPSIHE